MLIRPDATRDMLIARDRQRPGSADWQWMNAAAWRFHQMAHDVAPSDETPPPADFGLHYLEPQMGIAAE